MPEIIKMEDKIIKQLKGLKTKLDNQKMSVLVGAGFSKNVSNIFPTWWQLLYDLVLFLYEKEILDLYEIKKKNDKSLDKKKFIEEQVEYYINKIGYLDIVSQFIKQKGYRESITTYIEEKTPKIIIEKEKRYLVNTLSKKENKIELNQNMFSLHKILLNLNWNNIYTTNYDEMLEYANTSTSIENINDEIEDINNEIDALNNKIIITEKELKELETVYNIIPKKVSSSFFNLLFVVEDKDTAEIKKQKAKGNQLEQLRITIKNKIINKEDELNQLEKALSENFSLVTNSAELSIKRNKNIIKLHGTIRVENSSFGFDGDINKQYVIAKEDYETYPIKHEAFTQLMRISLLQESYCLVGFSGTDPNFLEWVKWVRDILERYKHNNEYKIYLVDVNDNTLNADKLLFFENHHILRIPLLKSNIIAFLEQETGKKINKKNSIKKEALELFFMYLSDTSIFNLSKTIFEVFQKNKYQKLWDEISIPLGNDRNIDSIKFDNSIKIARLKKYNPFPSVNFAYASNKHKLLFYGVSLLKELKNDELIKQLSLLILTAYRDTFLFPYFMWDKKAEISFKKIIRNKDLYNDFKVINLRQSVFNLDKRNFNLIVKSIPSGDKFKNEIDYNSILFSAFSLNFKELNYKLKKWKPSFYWSFKKAGINAILNNKESIEIATKNLPLLLNKSSQEQLISLQLYNYIKQNENFSYDKKVNDKIKKYKNAGIKDINENLDLIINQISDNKNKIEPYGAKRFSVSSGFSFSNDFTKQQRALQFIQILIEAGYPLSLQNVHLKKNSKWYIIFKTIFEYFPYPALFYSLQYSNKDFLKRIGQDYAYSDHLKSGLVKILKSLLEAYFFSETPLYLKNNILTISSELFISVHPNKWEKYVNKLLNDKTFINNAFFDRITTESEFIISSVKYIQSIQVIRKIVLLSLNNYTKNIAIDILYNLNSNIIFKKEGEKIQTKTISNSIASIISSISTNENGIFTIGNLDDILSDSQKNKVKVEISKINFNKIENERVWHIILYYLNDDQSFVKKIKSAIINNKKLWNTGITKKSLSSGTYFIEVSRLRKSKNNPKGITWAKSEAVDIFIKLKNEFSKIDNWLTKRPEQNFIFVLLEMKLFMEFEKDKIKDIPDFNLIYDKVTSLYYKQRGYNTVVEGLLSNENTKVVWALSEIAFNIYDIKQSKEVTTQITTLINKVLIKSEPSLEASIKYLSSFISDERNKSIFIKQKQLLDLILKEYYDEEFENLDKPYLFAQLIKIANTLRKWNYDSEYVNKWIKIKEQTVFNNIENELY